MAGQTPRTPPISLALLIADSIHIDPGSKKHFILGTFTEITAHQFPALHPQLGIYCELTNGHGRTHIAFKLARVTADNVDGEVLGTIEADAEFPDPRMILTMGGVIGNVVFPEPGEYRLSVEGNGRLLSERRLILRRLE